MLCGNIPFRSRLFISCWDSGAWWLMGDYGRAGFVTWGPLHYKPINWHEDNVRVTSGRDIYGWTLGNFSDSSWTEHRLNTVSSVREDYLYQIQWIFGKLPNGLWPPPPPYFRKTMLRFFREAQKFATKFIRICVTPPLFPKIHCFYRPKISGKTATKFFGSEMTPPHSEVFRKFIDFGRGSLP